MARLRIEWDPRRAFPHVEFSRDALEDLVALLAAPTSPVVDSDAEGRPTIGAVVPGTAELLPGGLVRFEVDVDAEALGTLEVTAAAHDSLGGVSVATGSLDVEKGGALA